MAKRVAYDSREITDFGDKMISQIGRAVVASAFKIRDLMREDFKNDESIYKYHNGRYKDLAEGIMIGKLKNGEIKVHALGSKDKYETYKTRFFVGGTRYREQVKRGGDALKTPYSKGFIQENKAVDDGASQGQRILDTYIGNVLK